MASHYCTRCLPTWEHFETYGSSFWQPCQKCGTREDVRHFPGDPLDDPRDACRAALAALENADEYEVDSLRTAANVAAKILRQAIKT